MSDSPSQNPQNDADFGQLLEAFESEQDVRQGNKRGAGAGSGQLVRTEPEVDKPAAPESLRLDTDEDLDFGAALEAYESEQSARVAGGRKEPAAGDKVTGPIVSLDLESALVDIGAKAEAIVATEDLTDEDGTLRYEVGDLLTAKVLGRDEGTGSLRLRPADAPSAVGIDVEVGQLVEGTVTAVNKGGVEVEIGKARAFCPISQLADRYVEDADAYVGRKLRFLVTKVERGRRGNLVLSRRQHLEEQKQAQAEITRASLEIGAALTGKVTAIESFGAFVDLGGIEGLVHISELAHAHVEHPKDLLTSGQQVDVKVLDIDRDPKGRDRISLSLKALERDPWLDAVSKFREGTTIEGTVRRLESFGAFVELEPGVEGLVHISELGGGRRLNHPREVLQEGQSLGVRVLKLEADRQRISLQPLEHLQAGDATDADAGGTVREALERNQQKGSFGSMAHFFDKAKK